MSTASEQESVLSQLQSKEQAQLLDAIDRLRDHGFSRDLELPQLIVCGNQSAGKSSVLEAISRVRFPAGEKCKTRFASEIVLRRDTLTSMKVKIIPAPDEEEQREYLNGFQRELTDLRDFPQVIEDASAHMLRSSSDLTMFSKHTLHVEISGPDQLHLTLVDLPGLISATTDGQSQRDIEVVRTITERHMENPKAIILAVMAATNDAATQPVLQLAANNDPKGQRTLGIITKPDRVEAGLEREVLKLVKNEEKKLALGWHVLKNREHSRRDVSPDERDALEEIFFNTGNWSSVPRDLCGVASLRSKLADLLFQKVSTSIPKLADDLRKGIRSCEQLAQKLGPPRPLEHQQREFVGNIQKQIDELVKEALEGTYNGDFFLKHAKPEQGSAKRLRMRLRNWADNFFKKMDRDGRRYCITEDPLSSKCAVHHRPLCQSLTSLEPGEETICVSIAVYCQALDKYIADRRGLELAGDFNPALIQQMIKVQTSPWESIAQEYIEACSGTVDTFLQHVLEHCTASHTASALHEHIVKGNMDAARTDLEHKLEELLVPTVSGPCTLVQNPNYLQRRLKYRDANLKNGIDVHNKLHSVTELQTRVDALYQVLFYTFIDNVILLAIEQRLVSRLKNLFASTLLYTMDDATRQAIAAEPDFVVQRREKNARKLKTFQDVLRICNKRGLNISANEETLERTTEFHSAERVEEGRGGVSIGSDTVPSVRLTTPQPKNVTELRPDLSRLSPPVTPSAQPELDSTEKSEHRTRVKPAKTSSPSAGGLFGQKPSPYFTPSFSGNSINTSENPPFGGTAKPGGANNDSTAGSSPFGNGNGKVPDNILFGGTQPYKPFGFGNKIESPFGLGKSTPST